jgi:hypothetical protein
MKKKGQKAPFFVPKSHEVITIFEKCGIKLALMPGFEERR